MSASPLPWEKYASTPAGPWEKYSSKSQVAEQPNHELPEGEIPLTSHWAATEQGFANIGKGALDAVSAMYNTVRHPIDTAKGMISAPGQFISQARQLPGAIRDINQSDDPAGTYLKAAGETAGEGGGQAIVAAATPAATRAAGSIARRAGNLTPKQAAQIMGGASGGIAGHGTLSAPGAYYGAKTAGKIAEGVLGERANQPIFGEPAPKPPSPSSPEAMREWWKSRGGGLADQPIDRRSMQGGPQIGQKQALLRQAEALRQPTREVVDQAIPPENKAANARAHSQVDFYLKKGDVEGAEKALDSIASKANPHWGPERPPYRGTTNDIREEIRAKADSLDDRATQQEMNWNLERHGQSAESEARREFIARNSTGTTKGSLNRDFDAAMGKPAPPEKPVRYTRTPGVKAGPPEGTTVPQTSEESIQALQKSVEQTKAGKGIDPRELAAQPDNQNPRGGYRVRFEGGSKWFKTHDQARKWAMENLEK